MDACDPDADIDGLREQVKLDTGKNLRLTREQICAVRKNIQAGRLPLPPMLLNRSRKYLTDRKSPLTAKDFERLFDDDTSLPRIQRIARKVDLKVENKSKVDLVEAIKTRLTRLKVAEPVKITKKRILAAKDVEKKGFLGGVINRIRSVATPARGENKNKNKNSNSNTNTNTNTKSNTNNSNTNRRANNNIGNTSRANNVNRRVNNSANNVNRRVNNNANVNRRVNNNMGNRNRNNGVRFPRGSIFQGQSKPGFLRRPRRNFNNDNTAMNMGRRRNNYNNNVGSRRNNNNNNRPARPRERLGRVMGRNQPAFLRPGRGGGGGIIGGLLGRRRKQPKMIGPMDNFIPAKKFNGAKNGYVFKQGNQGLGYYPNKPKIRRNNRRRRTGRGGSGGGSMPMQQFIFGGGGGGGFGGGGGGGRNTGGGGGGGGGRNTGGNNGALKKITENRNRIKKQLNAAQNKFNAEKANLQRQINSAPTQEEKKKLTANLARMAKEFENFKKEKNAEIAAEKTKAEEELKKKNANIKTLKNELGGANVIRRALENNSMAKNDEIERLKKELRNNPGNQELRNKLNRAEAEAANIREKLAKKNANIAKKNAQLNQATKKANAYKRSTQSQLTKIQELQQQAANKNARAKANLEAAQENARTKLEAAEENAKAKLEKAQENAKRNLEEAKRLARNAATAQAQKNAQAQIQAAKSQLKEAEQSMQSLANAFAEEKRTLNAKHKEELNNAKAKLTKANANIANKNAQLNQATKKANAYKRSTQSQLTKIQELQQQAANKNAKLTKANANIANRNAKLNNAKAKANNLQAKLTRANQNVKKLQNNLKNFSGTKNERNKLRFQLEEAVDTAKMLEEERQKFEKQAQQSGQAIGQLMSEKNAALQKQKVKMRWQGASKRVTNASKREAMKKALKTTVNNSKRKVNQAFIEGRASTINNPLYRNAAQAGVNNRKAATNMSAAQAAANKLRNKIKSIKPLNKLNYGEKTSTRNTGPGQGPKVNSNGFTEVNPRKARKMTNKNKAAINAQQRKLEAQKARQKAKGKPSEEERKKLREEKTWNETTAKQEFNKLNVNPNKPKPNENKNFGILVNKLKPNKRPNFKEALQKVQAEKVRRSARLAAKELEKSKKLGQLKGANRVREARNQAANKERKGGEEQKRVADLLKPVKVGKKVNADPKRMMKQRAANRDEKLSKVKARLESAEARKQAEEAQQQAKAKKPNSPDKESSLTNKDKKEFIEEVRRTMKKRFIGKWADAIKDAKSQSDLNNLRNKLKSKAEYHKVIEGMDDKKIGRLQKQGHLLAVWRLKETVDQRKLLVEKNLNNFAKKGKKRELANGANVNDRGGKKQKTKSNAVPGAVPGAVSARQAKGNARMKARATQLRRSRRQAGLKPEEDNANDFQNAKATFNDEAAAAVKIQAAVRGKQTRNKAKKNAQQAAAAVKIQKVVRARQNKIAQNAKKKLEEAKRMRAAGGPRRSRRLAGGEPEINPNNVAKAAAESKAKKKAAAVKIQAAVRGKQTRNKAKKNAAAAVKIQAAVRGKQARTKAKKNAAARTLAQWEKNVKKSNAQVAARTKWKKTGTKVKAVVRVRKELARKRAARPAFASNARQRAAAAERRRSPPRRPVTRATTRAAAQRPRTPSPPRRPVTRATTRAARRVTRSMTTR